MTKLAPVLRDLLGRDQGAVLVTLAEARGSTPRDSGARMLVADGASHGSIGGGRLEWEAIQQAQALLAAGEPTMLLDLSLGPALGQCCGGRVVLRLERAGGDTLSALAALERRDAEQVPQVVLFGAGHVGKALARAMAPLPLRLCWVDSRPDAFPDPPPDDVEIVAAEHPVEQVHAAPAGACFVVMTHSHPLDYELTEVVLRRYDFAYAGLIGSTTKRRRFERWFLARGGDATQLPRLSCPIGVGPVADKRPAVIAALIAAELLLAVAEAPAVPRAAAVAESGAG
jgi:xanthine dehydrogenase accessory protein XdhC